MRINDEKNSLFSRMFEGKSSGVLLNPSLEKKSNRSFAVHPVWRVFEGQQATNSFLSEHGPWLAETVQSLYQSDDSIRRG